jgi:hypothetical protein
VATAIISSEEGSGTEAGAAAGEGVEEYDGLANTCDTLLGSAAAGLDSCTYLTMP